MRVWVEEKQAKKKNKEPLTRKKSLLIISCALVLVLLALPVSAYISARSQCYVVNGLSMNPTLVEGDELIFRRANELTYGDVIVFESDYGLLAKRVIGLPGDVISVSAEGYAKRNGKIVDEPYVLEDPYMNSAVYDIKVEPGHLFVLGDNRGVSMDSRDSRIGQVPMGMVCGRVSSIQRSISNTMTTDSEKNK